MEINISPNSNLLNHNKEISFQVDYETDKKAVRVLAVTPEGIAYTYDMDKDEWVPQSSSWLNAPMLGDTLRVRLATQKNLFRLGVLIQDIKTGKVYKSEQHVFWNNATLAGDMLNNNLRKYALTKTERAVFQNTREAYVNGPDNSWIYIGGAVALIVALTITMIKSLHAKT